MTPQSDFLPIGVGIITPKGPMNTKNFRKTSLLSKIMNIRQVLIEVVSQSTNDLRGPFVGHIHFKKPMEFQKFMKCFTAA